MDNTKLISEVFNRESLWNTASKDYLKKRDLQKKLWKEVAVALKCECDIVKNRWKSIKDNYRVELKKLICQSKSGNETIIKPKWALFEHLDFLRDVLMPPKKNNQQRELRSKFEDSSDLITLINVKKEKPISKINISNNETWEDNISEISKTRKRKSTTEYNVEESEKPKFLRQEDDNINFKNDADYNFLISFLPSMKNMSELNNLKFRMEMSKILIKIKEEELRETN